MIDQLRIPFSGTVKSDGTFEIDLTPAVLQSYYAMILVSARHVGNGEVTGSPRWTLAGGGMALDFTVGSAVDLGPRLFSPGETVTVSGSGAQPQATISGVLHGTRAGTAAELLAGAYVPTPSTLGVQPTGTTQILADITTPANVNTSVTVPTPQTATALGYIAFVEGGFFPLSVIVTGVQSNQDYLFQNLNIDPVSTQFVPFAATNLVDQQLVCTVIGNGTTTSRAIFLASSLPIAQFVFGTVNLINSDVTIKPRFPDWQVVDLVSAITVPGIAGQRIFLDEATFTITNPGGGIAQNAQCQIWNGPSGTGVLIWHSRLALANATVHADHVQVGNKSASVGNAMTLVFDTAPVGNFFEIAASGFYV